MFFTRKEEGYSIEEFIKDRKECYKENWKHCLQWGFKDDALKWWKSFKFGDLMTFFDEAHEKLVSDKWSCVDKG
jgi:hypothetical protein